MAKKRIKNTDIFDPNWLAKTIAEFEALLAVTKKVEDNIKDILKSQQKALKQSSGNKSAADYKEQANNIKLVALAEKELIRIEKEREKLNEQKSRLQKKLVKEKKQTVKLTEKEAIAVAKSKLELAAYNKRIKDIARSQMTAAKSTNTWGKAVNSFAFKFNFLGNAISSVAGRITGGLSRAFNSAINTIKEFSKANSDLAAVLGTSKDDIKELIADSKRLGQSTKFTATQVAQLQKEFAKLGFTKKEILGITEATLDLAAATDSDLGEAATIAGSTIRAFGLKAKDSQRVVDSMAKAFSSSSLDINKYATAMGAVAPVAKNAGVSIERTTAILGKVSDAGVDASTAGTALRNIYLELAKKGLTFEDAMKKINTSTNKNATAMELFGKRGATVATIIADNTEEIDKLTIALNESEGAAKQMAETMQDNLTGDLDKLTSAWEGFILSIEEGNGAMARFSRGFTQALTEDLNFINNDAIPTWEKFIGLIVPATKSVREMGDKLKAEGRELFESGKSREEIVEQLMAEGRNRLELGHIITGYTDAMRDARAVRSQELKDIIASTAVYNKEEEAIEADTAAIRKRTKEIEKEQKANKNFKKIKGKGLDSDPLMIAGSRKQTTVDALAVDRFQRLADEKLEIQKDYLRTIQQIADEIDKVVQKEFDKKQELLDKEITQSKKHQEELKALAQKGVEDAADNLAFEQKKQAELELQKAKDEKKLQAAQMTTEFLKIYSANAENDPNTALSKTVKEIFVVRQAAKALASLDKGTENTSQVNQDAQVSDGKGGFLAVLHPEERVLNKEQNKMVSGISNEKLAKLGQEYKQGGAWETNQQIINKFDELKKSVDRMQKADFDYNKITNILTSIVETRNSKINTHKKIGTLFN